MNKIHIILIQYYDEIPAVLIEGVLYISLKFKVAIHLCACGCGVETVTPFKNIINGQDRGWSIIEINGKITLRPSIGNFSGEQPYHAHYYITENKIDWLD